MSTSVQFFCLDRDDLEQIAVGVSVVGLVFFLLVEMGECASKGWC